jgi:hypothetical protein
MEPDHDALTSQPDPDVWVQFWLPAIAIGAAFAILRNKDGQLRKYEWIYYTFGVVLCSALPMFVIEAILALAKALGALEWRSWLTNGKYWALMLSGAIVLIALVDRAHDREMFSLRRRFQKKSADDDDKA